MITHHTYCALRLGDNLAALHFLRKLAERYPDHQFRHAAHVCYLNQMIEVVYDLENIKLLPLEYRDAKSLSLWKNEGGFWENHPRKNEYAVFMLEFFAMAAQEMGLVSPMQFWTDLLFDYPAIQKKEPLVEPFDALIVNSPPLSGQAPHYQIDAMDFLISDLAKKYKILLTHPSRVQGTVSTSNRGYSVTDIGNCSLFCKLIVMVSTGPSWPTLNVWNRESVERRFVILQNERLGLGTNEVYAPDVTGIKSRLHEYGYL